MNYRWKKGAWKRCELPDGIDQPCAGNRTFEIGVQNRQLDCVRDSNRLVESSLCESSLLPPTASRKCRIQCPISECTLSSWMEWSSCSRTCLPSYRYRERAVLEFSILCSRAQLIQFDDCREMTDCMIPEEEIFSSRWSKCVKQTEHTG